MRGRTSGAQETSAGQKSTEENCPARDAGEKLAAAKETCVWPRSSRAETVCTGEIGWLSPRYSRDASSQTRLRTSSRKRPARASAAITALCSARRSGSSSGMTAAKASGRSHSASSASAEARMASMRRDSTWTSANVRGEAVRTQSRDMARLLCPYPARKRGGGMRIKRIRSA